MLNANNKAKTLLKASRPLQTDNEKVYKYKCPRCGHTQMDKEPIKNSLSRRVNLYICNSCGLEEAMLDYLGIPPLPLTEWAMIKYFDNKNRGGYVLYAYDE